MKKPVPGIYQHYKGEEKKYRVHFVAKHSETLEDLVAYEALYENKDGKYWVRPLKMFLENVTLDDGTTVPRFKLIKAD